MQKGVRIAALVLVVGFLGALIVFNALNPNPPDMATWNAKMSKGDPSTAKHHFIMYTDIFCPYCDKFSDAIAANLDDFEQKYIKDNNVLFEIRVTQMNYENGHSNNSQPAGVAAYCAAEQGNFWDYYYALLAKIYKDYHSKGIGVDKNSEKIPDLDKSYFYDFVGDIDGLDQDKMKTCVEENQTLAELKNNTKKARPIVNGGVPHFTFDKFTYDGFYGNWDTTHDYEQAKLLLDAGLTTK